MPKVALVMDFKDIYDHGIVRGVIRYAKSASRWELFGHDWMFGSLDDPASWRGDGVIARVANRETAARVAGIGVPVVDVAGAFDEYGFVRVTNDDVRTGTIAGEHFQTLGLHHFAYCGTGTLWSNNRRDGFTSTTGSPVAEFTQPLEWWETRPSDDYLTPFLVALPQRTGLFAANDTVALGVLRCARAAGIVVPHDLCVIGVDNEDITCEFAMPSLSSINLRLEEIGFAAAERLDGLFTNPHARASTTIPPGRLIERDSTRVFPTNDSAVRRTLELIYANSGSIPSVTDLAMRTAVGRRTLEIRFKKETGKTIHQAVIHARMLRAAELLRETTDKISAIAAAVGFRSTQRFFELFRERAAMTPHEFRCTSSEIADKTIDRLRKNS